MRGIHVFFLLLSLFIVIFVVFAYLAFSGTGLQLGNSIAVIPVKGEIVSETGDVYGGLSAMEIVEKIQEAQDTQSVKAILLEINSPGGSVVASRQVVEKIRGTEKPVVAWISDLGASGGYYVASACDFIVADADSITGSIGVIAMFPNIEGLLEKIGVKVKIIKQGTHKATGSPFEGISPEEEAMIQELLESAFERFRNDVLEFRKERISVEEFERIADGRIVSGEQAKKIGLIDEIGTRELALAKAAELGGIEDYEIVDYSEKNISFLELVSSAGYSVGMGIKHGILPQTIPSISARIQ